MLIWAVKRKGKEGRKEGRKEGKEGRGADSNDVANSMANIKQLVICSLHFTARGA